MTLPLMGAARRFPTLFHKVVNILYIFAFQTGAVYRRRRQFAIDSNAFGAQKRF
jgi:hypothetical protein